MSVSFWGRDDLVTDLDDAIRQDFGEDASAIKEGILEALPLAREFLWSLAWSTILHSTKAHSTDGELLVDEVHEFDSLGKDVPPTVGKFETTPFKEGDIHEGDLAVATCTPVKATFTGRIAIAF